MLSIFDKIELCFLTSCTFCLSILLGIYGPNEVEGVIACVTMLICCLLIRLRLKLIFNERITILKTLAIVGGIMAMILGHIIFGLKCKNNNCFDNYQSLYLIILIFDFLQYLIILIVIIYLILATIKWYFVPLNNEYKKLDSPNKVLFIGMVIMLILILALLIPIVVYYKYFEHDLTVTVSITLLIIMLLIFNHIGFYNSQYKPRYNEMAFEILIVIITFSVLASFAFMIFEITNAGSERNLNIDTLLSIILGISYIILLIGIFVGEIIILMIVLIELLCLCFKKVFNRCCKIRSNNTHKEEFEITIESLTMPMIEIKNNDDYRLQID